MQKDILAKLLATENITVIHENAPTASFNVRDRVLTLPLWEDLTGDNYDHFIGHEVGHALYTPEEGWHDAVCDRGRAFKSFLNVVEDARIERLIQSKYPGLRRNFINSYRKLLAEGFFGASIEEINEYDLIDRINSYFKLGQTAGIRIEKDEMCWIEEIEKCTTWDEVVDIAERLFAQEKAKKEQELEEQQSFEETSETQEQYSDGLSDSDWEFDQDEEEDEDGTESGQSPSQSDENDDEYEEEECEYGDQAGADPISKTEEALHDNIHKVFGNDSDTSVYNLKLNTNDVSPLIIKYKEVYNFGINRYPGQRLSTKDHLSEYGEELWKQFQATNKKSVNYMVKEFEMKKKAAEYARTTVAKTGVIDSVKMNGYKFSEDIFRKMSVTPQGKNHGMVMYVDWSGSMNNHIKPTIDQVLNLVMFCRQVNIPYRVYLFTDRFTSNVAENITSKVNGNENNTLVYKLPFRLLEIFNNKMTRSEFTKMSQLMLAVAQNYDKDVAYDLPWQFYLGGTPLDDTIMAAIQIHNDFKKSNRLDIVNTVFLTDGDSHPIEATVQSRYNLGLRSTPVYHLSGSQSIVNFIDPVTKKRYRVNNGRSTKALLEMFRDHTGSNAIGYRIMSMNKRSVFGDLRSFVPSYSRLEEMYDELRRNKFITIPNAGYDKFFAVAGGKNLEVADTTINVSDDAKVHQIRTAFKKANSGRKMSRVLLSQFIDMVA